MLRASSLNPNALPIGNTMPAAASNVPKSCVSVLVSLYWL
jgi:hypothetical protein